MIRPTPRPVVSCASDILINSNGPRPPPVRRSVSRAREEAAARPAGRCRIRIRAADLWAADLWASAGGNKSGRRN